MAKSPSDNSGHDSGIGFGADGGSTPGESSGTPGIEKGFSQYADDTNEPTSPQSQEGFRSKAWGKDTEDINRQRTN